MVDKGNSVIYGRIMGLTNLEITIKNPEKPQKSLTKKFMIDSGAAYNASFQYQNEIGASPVIFGDKDDIFLLGVVTLESLGLILDPIRRELKPLPMLLV